MTEEEIIACCERGRERAALPSTLSQTDMERLRARAFARYQKLFAHLTGYERLELRADKDSA